MKCCAMETELALACGGFAACIQWEQDRFPVRQEECPNCSYLFLWVNVHLAGTQNRPDPANCAHEIRASRHSHYTLCRKHLIVLTLQNAINAVTFRLAASPKSAFHLFLVVLLYSGSPQALLLCSMHVYFQERARKLWEKESSREDLFSREHTLFAFQALKKRGSNL